MQMHAFSARLSTCLMRGRLCTPPRRYEMIKDIGSGNFGVAKLMRDRATGELVAVKFIERGEKIDKCVVARFLCHEGYCLL